MAATLEEYRDILIADTYVDLARLKMRAQVRTTRAPSPTSNRWGLAVPQPPSFGPIFSDANRLGGTAALLTGTAGSSDHPLR